MSVPAGARPGLRVVHRRYVPQAAGHYAGGLVDGAYALGLFGDAATEACVRSDGDEGLLASYRDVQFLAPIRAGDVVEALATLVRVGRRSRDLELELRVVCRSAGDTGRPSAARVLDPPVVAVRARATVVVPG